MKHLSHSQSMHYSQFGIRPLTSLKFMNSILCKTKQKNKKQKKYSSISATLKELLKAYYNNLMYHQYTGIDYYIFFCWERERGCDKFYNPYL